MNLEYKRSMGKEGYIIYYVSITVSKKVITLNFLQKICITKLLITDISKILIIKLLYARELKLILASHTIFVLQNIK